MITHISPLGSMDMLSQLEVDMLKRTASSDLYQLFRNCSLAVLNSGSLTDNSKELLSRFESFDINVLRREHVPVSIYLVNGIKLQGQVESFDQYVVLLENTVTQMVYKHAISTVVPSRPVSIPQDAGDDD